MASNVMGDGTFRSSGPTVFSVASFFSLLPLKQPMMSLSRCKNDIRVDEFVLEAMSSSRDCWV